MEGTDRDIPCIFTKAVETREGVSQRFFFSQSDFRENAVLVFLLSPSQLARATGPAKPGQELIVAY